MEYNKKKSMNTFWINGCIYFPVFNLFHFAIVSNLYFESSLELMFNFSNIFCNNYIDMQHNKNQ